MPDDRIVISSEPGLTPDEIARRSFPVVFRGYEQDQVRRLLKRVADELAAARQREQDLHRALEEARSPRARPELDEAALTAALGEETTRILLSAREAAADMRSKAEERVARMVQEADEHGARLRLEAENILARRVEEADEVAANIRSAAEADAKAMRDQVQAELEAARARGKEMVAEAQAVRERVIGDLARRRRAAQIQIEQLLAGRDRLLDTYKSVRRTLDEVTAELAHAEDEARMAAEAAQRKAAAAAPDDGDLAAMAAQATDAPTASSAPVVPDPVPAHPTFEPAAAPTPAPPPAEPAEQPRPSLVRLQALDEDEGVRIIGPATSQPEPAVTEPPPTFLELDELTPAPALDQAPSPPLDVVPEPVVAPPPPPPPEAPAPEHEGSVEDLFARLRAQRQAAVADAEKVLAPVAPTEAQTAPEDAAPEGEPEGAGGDGADQGLLEERDEIVEPLTHDLTRRLKRVLQDEQNEILDRLRKMRGRADPDEALPPVPDQARRYRDAASDALAEAARRGAAFSGATPASDPPVQDWAQALADELVGGLRERVVRSLSRSEETNGSDAADGLGAAYRQWKTERIDQIASHHVAAAFNQGVLAAAPEGAELRWVFGDSGPCPDCDDNVLAGPTPKGEAYPTGQLHPPAHAGCGCLLIVAAGGGHGSAQA